MEKLLKKDVTFLWDDDCQKSLDTLKEKMVTMPILVFLDWKKEFHVHVDTSCIALGAVLTQVSEGELDHPIAFTSRKLLKNENNYLTMKRKGFTMVYKLQKFRHYLLGRHFRMYTDHYALKYLVNNVVLEGGDMHMAAIIPGVRFQSNCEAREIKCRFRSSIAH